jgi:hypothetical protein
MSRGADHHVVRLDWSTLATTEVAELASLNEAMCMSSQFTLVVPPPDTMSASELFAFEPAGA